MGDVFKFKEARLGSSKDDALLESLCLPEGLVPPTGQPGASEPAVKRRAVKARETQRFIYMLEDEYVAGAAALGCQQLSVWVFILRQWRITGKPVAVTNAVLRALHVRRKAKYAALKKLAEAGLIRVTEGSISRNPRVVPIL
jgi:hypothetical protein